MQQGARTDLPSNEGKSVSTAEAAKMMNVSTSSVERAKKRKREDPEAHEAAKSVGFAALAFFLK